MLNMACPGSTQSLLASSFPPLKPPCMSWSVLQVLAAMWDHLLLRTPQHIASTVCSAVLNLMQDKGQAPHHPPGHTPPAPAQPTGTTTSAGQHPDSMEAQQAATAAALSGPDNVAKDCDLAVALSVLGSKPGGWSQRCAMLSAAARAWPDDPAGVLGLMLLEDVVLGPGEAVIIPAGCPHAYVCGELGCKQGSGGFAAWSPLSTCLCPNQATARRGRQRRSTAALQPLRSGTSCPTTFNV